MDIITPRAGQDLLLGLQCLNYFLSSLATQKLKLFQNNIIPGDGTTSSDFVEATFDTYAAKTITAWNSPVTDPVTLRQYTTPTATTIFTDTGSTTPNTIYGWYLEDSGGTIICCQRFNTPVVMDAAGKSIQLTIRLFESGLDGPDAYED